MGRIWNIDVDKTLEIIQETISLATKYIDYPREMQLALVAVCGTVAQSLEAVEKVRVD